MKVLERRNMKRERKIDIKRKDGEKRRMKKEENGRKRKRIKKKERWK